MKKQNDTENTAITSNGVLVAGAMEKSLYWWNNIAELKFHLLMQYFPHVKHWRQLWENEIFIIWKNEVDSTCY